MGTNVSTNYITCPADPNKTLGIKLPFLVMILKNLKKYFTSKVKYFFKFFRIITRKGNLIPNVLLGSAGHVM